MTRHRNASLWPIAALMMATFAFTAPASAGVLMLTNLGDGNVNLTDAGGADWKLWSDANLTPDEQKLGGIGIGALSFTGTGGLNTANSSQNVRFSWTDGSPTVSATNVDVDHLVSITEDNTAAYSTSVGANTLTNSLYVTYGQWNATSRLTASLSDGSVGVQILDISATDDHQTVRIDFASDTSAMLDVSVEFLTDEGATNSSLRFQGLALANSSNADIIYSEGFEDMLRQDRAINQ